MTARLVILESPYSGDVERNVKYARASVRDSLSRGEAPIASHLLYRQPGILRDDVPTERQWGIAAGLEWVFVADAMVVYEDYGISDGMRDAIEFARRAGKRVEYRRLSGFSDQQSAVSNQEDAESRRLKPESLAKPTPSEAPVG